MLRDQGSAPSWLYSFVDLAFLLVIVLSLLGLEGRFTPDLGELQVPRVHASAPLSPPDAPDARWQLRVHPDADADAPPFELAPVGAAPREVVERIERTELQARLRALQGEGVRKPLLAPHEDSRSADLLEAVGLVEELWPGGRPVLVSAEPDAE